MSITYPELTTSYLAVKHCARRSRRRRLAGWTPRTLCPRHSPDSPQLPQLGAVPTSRLRPSVEPPAQPPRSSSSGLFGEKVNGDVGERGGQRCWLAAPGKHGLRDSRAQRSVCTAGNVGVPGRVSHGRSLETFTAQTQQAFVSAACPTV